MMEKSTPATLDLVIKKFQKRLDQGREEGVIDDDDGGDPSFRIKRRAIGP